MTQGRRPAWRRPFHQNVKRGFNSYLTISHLAAILGVQTKGAAGRRLAPQVSFSKRVTACVEAGRLLLFCLKTQANNADYDNAELKQL